MCSMYRLNSDEDILLSTLGDVLLSLHICKSHGGAKREEGEETGGLRGRVCVCVRVRTPVRTFELTHLLEMARPKPLQGSGSKF